MTDGLGNLIGTAIVDAGGNWTITPATPLPEGSTPLVITATDPAGNVSSPLNSQITIDTAAPSVPTIATPMNGSTTADTTPTISGTAEPGATVTITTSAGTVLGTAIADASGNYSFTPTTPLADGPLTLDVTATDAAGNVYSTATTSFTIDSTASGAPVVTSPTSGSSTTDTTPAVTGTGDPGSTITIYSATGAVLGTTIVDPSGAWSFTPLTPIPDGIVTFSFTQTDGAGNVSPTATLTFAINAGPASVQASGGKGGGGGGVP